MKAECVYLCIAISTPGIVVRANYHIAVSETRDTWAEIQRRHRRYINPVLEVNFQVGGFSKGFQLPRREEESGQGTRP